jgi:hypothetical protein
MLSNAERISLLAEHTRNGFVKKIFGFSPKIFGSTYIAQSPRKCLNFKILAKIEGKEANFFQKFTKGI